MSETFLILRIMKTDTVIHVHRSSCKVHVVLVRIYLNFNFFLRFSKNN